MSALSLGIAAALIALRCQLISDDPYVLGSVSSVIPATRPAFLRALNETRRLIGCPPAGDPQEPAGAFSGGQCAGVGYTVNVAGTANPPGGSGMATRSGVGPVGGMCFQDAGFGNVSIGVQFVDGCQISGAGQALTVPSVQSSWQIVSITRDDGLPDDCGNPPGIYPPPTNVFQDVDVTYKIEGDTNVTVTIPFIFAPITANFDGTLRIPFNFDFGGFEFSGDINLPDFNVTINPPRVPPGSGEDLTGEGDDEPGGTVPPAPPGEKIIGIVVNATDIDSTVVSSYSGPYDRPILVPRLGSIKFAYSIGTSTFFSSDIDIKERRTFVPCPFSQGADDVVASAQPGIELTFTPIRGFPLATTNDIVRSLDAG